LWRTYTISQPARPYARNSTGTQLYGPAGGSVWSAPTLDPEHDLLYVGTGNSYTDVPTDRTDSILALRMSTGAVVWANQLRPKDNYIVGCDTPASAGQGNCPHALGPDVDFGTSPILRTLSNGERVLISGEKSGRVYGLDPASGKERWHAQLGVGSSLGGIEWGSAADGESLYAPVSDAAAVQGRPGGLQLGSEQLPRGAVPGRDGDSGCRFLRLGGRPPACLCQHRRPCHLGRGYGAGVYHRQ
jgi:polyvinyl alcohol dehydrogenase (cytochrome)